LTTTHRLSLVRTLCRCYVSAPPVLRWLLLAGTVLLTTAMSAHAQSVASEEALTAEQAQKDVRILKRALQELHPALTKYQSQAQMDAAFARFELRGAAARTASEMFLAATELAAAIRCGHTWTNLLNQSGPAKRALLDAKNKLPLTLALVQSRFLVLASATAGITAGDEVLQLDGATPDGHCHAPFSIPARRWQQRWQAPAAAKSWSRRLQHDGHRVAAAVSPA
jgi:hypothetical protein